MTTEELFEGVMARLRKAPVSRGVSIDELEKIGGRPTRHILLALQGAGVVLKEHAVYNRAAHAWSLVAEPDVPADWLQQLVEEHRDNERLHDHIEQMSFEDSDRRARSRLTELESLAAPQNGERLTVSITVDDVEDVRRFERLVFERYSARRRVDCVPSSIHLDDVAATMFRTPNGVEVTVHAEDMAVVPC